MAYSAEGYSSRQQKERESGFPRPLRLELWAALVYTHSARQMKHAICLYPRASVSSLSGGERTISWSWGP
jgi:hypothetical protein